MAKFSTSASLSSLLLSIHTWQVCANTESLLTAEQAEDQSARKLSSREKQNDLCEYVDLNAKPDAFLYSFFLWQTKFKKKHEAIYLLFWKSLCLGLSGFGKDA